MLKFKLTLTFLICLFTTFCGLQAQDVILEAIESDNIGRLANVLMIENIDDCIEIDGEEISYLAAAIKLESKDAMSFLISAGANVDAVCKNETPLVYAVKNGHLESVKKLIEAGANTHIKNGDKTLMYYAKKYKHRHIAKYLESKVAKN